MTRIQRTFRKVAVSALTATTIVVGASVIPLTAATAANAATAVPTSEIISRAVDEAKKQGAAQDYTQTITKPQRKILWVAFSDVTYSPSGRHEKMDANERIYTKTVVDQFAKVMDTRIGVQVSSTLRWVDTPFVSKDAEGRIHEGDITNVLNQQAALAEYDSIMVISKGNNGGVTLGAYFDDKTTRGSGYSYASLLAPANAAQPGSGYPGPTAEVDYSTEVAIHEFCHQLQFNGVGFPYVDLHDFSIYSKYASGMQFYTDYLTGKVKKDGIAYGTYPKMWAVSQRFLHNPGMATVHYQNAAGQTIAADANAYGPGGESYDIKARSIAGYKSVALKAGSASAAGTFTTGTKADITFVYSASATDVRFLGGQTFDLFQGGARATGYLYANSYTYNAAVPLTGYTYADRIVSMDGARRGDVLYGVQLNWNANGTATFSKGGNTYSAVKKSDALVEVSVSLAQPVTSFTVDNLSYGNIAPAGQVHQTLQVLAVTPTITGRSEPVTTPQGHTTLTWGDYKDKITFVGGETWNLDSVNTFAPGTVYSNYYIFRAAVPVTGFSYTDTLNTTDGVKRLDSLNGTAVTWNPSGVATVTRDGNTYTLVKKSDTRVEVTVTLGTPSATFTMHGMGHTSSAPTGRATRTLALVDITSQLTAAKQTVASTTPKGNMTMTWGAYKDKVTFLGGETWDFDSVNTFAPGTVSSNFYVYRAAVPVTKFTYTDTLNTTDGVKRLDSLYGTAVAWNAYGVATLTRDGNTYTLVKKTDTRVDIDVTLGTPSTTFYVLGLGHTNSAPTGRATRTLALASITPQLTGTTQDVPAATPKGNMTMTWGDYKVK